MVYGYCRVSTRGQLDGNSIKEQQDAIISIYNNAKIIVESRSGAKCRPVFNELIETLEDSDIIVVTKLDRFCRTTKEGLEYIDKLISKGVKVHVLNMGLIEDSPMGRLIATNLLAFAEFERAMILERTMLGKSIARKNPNFKEGRPRKYNDTEIGAALKLLKENTYSQVVEMTGISRSTLARAKAALKTNYANPQR